MGNLALDLKLNALGIPPVCKAANPVLIHSLKRYAVLRRMGLPVALCPVSYTHLDVYKRQVKGLPLGKRG